MDIRVINWTYLNQECVLLQSVNRNVLESKASTLQEVGYTTELQSFPQDGEISFYTLLATKTRQQHRWAV